MECRCRLEGKVVVPTGVKKVEVCVVAEGEVEVMRETVEMVVRRKRGRCFEGLEEIPEQCRLIVKGREPVYAMSC
ncbi:hypothetical protein L6452_01713 [Arctium lappa]|uniref:Uncharacterized protein n=1 Tax=Arctium lappa TaxID=4217 RepID=A0ACB9FID0_ARCLA|nr:hypothetical protein L6452_01713 [Arctium lappa]